MSTTEPYNTNGSWQEASVSPPSVVQFADQNIRRNERGKLWSLFGHQRKVLARMYERHYSIRLWSEPKKSGKTFIAAVTDCKASCCRISAGRQFAI